VDLSNLRNPETARQFLLQGLWLQRVLPPEPATVKPILECALELAADGQALPPVGFVADLCHIVLGRDRGARSREDTVTGSGLPPGLLRTYEDHVLGKLYADWTFASAGDALRQYQGRDQTRALAFLIQQFCKRAHFDGVLLNPAVIKSVLNDPPDRTLATGWNSLEQYDLMPELLEAYGTLIGLTRRMAEVLGSEDLFELQHRRVLAKYGERVALRQVLHMAECLETTLPQHRVRPRQGRQEVPTRVLDEDTYPVGGFSSLSTRGSVESLLHSQLAYMEKEERPDLFDIKFLRDELLYYSRDDNQFLRRRQTFVFALFPDLIQARFKDTDSPCQRIILLLALLRVVVSKLSEWLSTDALVFEFVFVAEKEPGPLAPERELVKMFLPDQIAAGTVKLLNLGSVEAIVRYCEDRAQRSQCQCLAIAVTDQPMEVEATVVTRLRLDGPVPTLANSRGPLEFELTEDLVECWGAGLETLLQVWV
jgi:hypothetical protein